MNDNSTGRGKARRFRVRNALLTDIFLQSRLKYLETMNRATGSRIYFLSRFSNGIQNKTRISFLSSLHNRSTGSSTPVLLFFDPETRSNFPASEDSWNRVTRFCLRYIEFLAISTGAFCNLPKKTTRHSNYGKG